MLTPVPASAHEMPQPPQLFGSLDVSTSHPLDGSLSQSALGGVHVGLEQVPPEQASVPPNVLQACPQEPQFSGSLEVLISQPSAKLLLQSLKGAVHIGLAQALAEQLSVPPGRLHV